MMGAAIRPIADVFTLGTAELIKPATGFDPFNPTGNPALAAIAPLSPSASLTGQSAEEEQLSRQRASVAASALAATREQNKTASGSLLGPAPTRTLG